MTAHEFLISKGVVSLKESYSIYEIQKWLGEYGDIVLSVAAEKAKVGMNFNFTGNVPYVIEGSILNCLKE